ncbi:hypothetical protein [Variovorax sp. 770b2]|uniref:hypothetical protein n=1 Tax=Variovorax sp. 770b2 TaxID=1566271 RepID=UPI000B211BE7|nr:hypothetical protein [Variovorax sp. 770b2]
MPASGPFGKWTKADLADELNISHGYFSQVVLDKGCPNLEPDLIAGRQHLFSDDTAERWLATYRKWREEEPARKAAKRAEIAARVSAETRAEMNRIAAEQRVMAEAQAARAQLEADEAAFNAEAAKGWK